MIFLFFNILHLLGFGNVVTAVLKIWQSRAVLSNLLSCFPSKLLFDSALNRNHSDSQQLIRGVPCFPDVNVLGGWGGSRKRNAWDVCSIPIWRTCSKLRWSFLLNTNHSAKIGYLLKRSGLFLLQRYATGKGQIHTDLFSCWKTCQISKVERGIVSYEGNIKIEFLSSGKLLIRVTLFGAIPMQSMIFE